MNTQSSAGATAAPQPAAPAGRTGQDGAAQGGTAPGGTAQGTAAIPFRRDGDLPSSTLAGGGIGVLAISLVAIGVVLYLRKRLNLHVGQAGQGRALRVVESARLGPRAVLSVVEFDGTRYLVAQSEQGVSCLAEKPAPRETP